MSFSSLLSVCVDTRLDLGEDVYRHAHFMLISCSLYIFLKIPYLSVSTYLNSLWASVVQLCSCVMMCVSIVTTLLYWDHYLTSVNKMTCSDLSDNLYRHKRSDDVWLPTSRTELLGGFPLRPFHHFSSGQQICALVHFITDLWLDTPSQINLQVPSSQISLDDDLNMIFHVHRFLKFDTSAPMKLIISEISLSSNLSE